MDTFIISITDACPLNCIGCYATKHAPHMDFEDFKQVIDKLPDCKSITITGGEPFIHPKLVEMVKYCAETKMKPRIVTSGFINHHKISEVAPFVELITVTIKYPSDIDSAWKRAPDTYMKAEDFLDTATSSGIPTAINWIADQQNKAYILDMLKLASKHKSILEIVRFIPYDGLHPLALTEEQWNKLCMFAKQFKDVHIAFPSSVSYVLCVGGVNRLYIQTDGTVTPCIYVRDRLGNIFEDDYTRIENNGQKWRMQHKAFNGKTLKGCIGLLKEYYPQLNKLWEEEEVMLQ